MENEEEPEMYVCDPVKNKDGVKAYTSYTLKGSRVPVPLNRRYRDFDALRKKLVERGLEFSFQIFLIKKR